MRDAAAMTINERLHLLKKLARLYGTHEVINPKDTFKWSHKYTFTFFLPNGFSRERNLFDFPEPCVVRGTLIHRPRITKFEAHTDSNIYRGTFSTHTNSWEGGPKANNILNAFIDNLILYADWTYKEEELR